MPISKDVGVNRSGIGMMGVVDNGSKCVVMTNGGYEIMDLELKWSDDILMLAMVMMNDSNKKRESVCVNKCVVE